MIPITLLRPVQSNAVVAKTFELNDGKPVLTVAYDLGKYFKFKEITVDGIRGFYDTLQKCSDAPLFRIAGKPRNDLSGTVERNNENFVNAGTRLLLIDCDDTPVPEGFSLKTPEGIRETIIEIVCKRMGITPLAGVSFCVLLSSSFWNYRRLRAHVYYEISDNVDIVLLREWAMSYNKGNPEYKIDPAMFRQVQPDFISRRVCKGFVDPLPDSLRLTLHCDNLAPSVDKAALVEHFNTVIATTSAFNSAISTTSVVSNTDKVGDTWEESIKLCGTAQHGINDPAYRACAQLVQSVGNKVVEQNLNYYVEKIFNLAWQAINTNGIRADNKKDRDYYDKNRFRGYLATALKKNFGEGTDAKAAEVAKALKKVIAGANPSILFDRDMIEIYRTIRAKDPGKWSQVRAIVKTKLKGVVNIADIDKALSSFNKTDIGSMMDQIFGAFNWIEGTIDQGLYCKRDNGKSYSLVGIDGGVESDLYTKAIELFSDAVPQNFERNLMKVLVSRSRDTNTSPFHRAVVENRFYTEIKNGKNITYINLGVIDKEMTTCVVEETGVRLIPSLQSPVIWSTDRMLQPIELNYCEKPTIGKENKLISGFISSMRKFVTVEDAESLIDVIAWQIAAVINTGTAHLLEFTGASGDGKTVSALFTKELIDPTSSDIREGQDLHNGFYKKEDLAKILRSRHVTIIDNLSNITPAMQDLLCSIATGWKFDLRVMYTQEFLRLVIKKPLILTALGPVITNQDLRSRSFSVAVTKKKKVHVGDIYALWEKEKANMRMGLFLLVARVIKDVNARRAAKMDLNARDLWGIIARKVVMKHVGYLRGDEKKIEQKIEERKRARDINEALLSAPSAQVIAWISNDTETFHGGDVHLTATEMYYKFKTFINEKAGEELRVGGSYIEVSTKHIPGTPRAFGILVARIKNDIQVTTGYELDNFRAGGIKKWKFEKRINVYS